MRLQGRIWNWLFNDGELKDADFERLLFVAVIILAGLFIGSVSTILVSSLHSILAQPCP